MALFSMDSKFMRFVGQLVDVLVLNLLWLAFSLPLVTVGASTVAACSVAMKMLDGEEGYVARSFVKAFRANIRQGTVIWLLNAAAAYALWLDWQIVLAADNPSVALMIASIVSTAFAFCAFVYAYPITARYENTVVRILSNSVRLCVRYFGRTMLLVAVVALEIALFIWSVPMMVAGILVGPAILLYTASGIAKRIFQRLERGEP
jgi:uncharacterized membrane protein YesL